jgi:putative ATPase
MDLIERGEGTEHDLIRLLEQTLRDPERGLGALGLTARTESLARIAHAARGNARRALGLLELVARSSTENGRSEVTSECIDRVLATGPSAHDAGGASHASLAQVFTLSMRAGDVDAALYWMLRMLQAGMEPPLVLRRMIVFASEDIGNADPRALELAMTTDQVVHRLGMPEALQALGQCCAYLASARKSKASHLALQRAERDLGEHGALPIPLGRTGTKPASYLPEALLGRKYYTTEDQSFESLLLERLEQRKRG